MLVGPSYTLANRRAAVQRAINLMLRPVEAGNEKAGFYLDQCPGLEVFSALGAPIRGALTAGGRLFVVAGQTLYEVSSIGGVTNKGTLLTTSGRVDMAWGTTQLVIVDGLYGYVLTLSSGAFARITDPDFYGSERVAYLDGFFLFVRPDTQQFYISAIDDASDLDALDFASAESSPDKLKAVIADHREVWLMGEQTVEVWFNAGAADFPFQRNQGASLEVGCVAVHSARQVDNSVFWLGSDKNGQGIVWRAQGYQPMRISTQAVEEALAQSSDLSQAVAFSYVRNGQTCYGITAPGLSATWVYDAQVGQWHERCELVNGELEPIRYDVHAAFAGMNLVGGSDGTLYELTTANTLAGDVMYRERTSPHSPNPARERQLFSDLELDVTVGETGQGTSPVVEMQYSNDGGFTWSNWISRSLGEVGKYSQRVKWSRLGSAFDRVWRVRCTSDARFAIFGEAVR